MTTIDRTDERTFDVDDEQHTAMREQIAALVGEKNGEAVHPDPVVRADA